MTSSLQGDGFSETFPIFFISRLPLLLLASLLATSAIWSYRCRSGKAGAKAAVVQDACSFANRGPKCGPWCIASRANRVIWFMASSAFIGYWSRSMLSIVIIELSHELELDNDKSALALSAFYYGYVFANMLGPKLMQLFGPRFLILVTILGSSLATLTLVPFVAAGGAGGLIFCRAVVGLLQGCLYPCIYTIFSAEFNLDEASRNRAMSLLGGMPSLGIAANFLVSPLLVHGLGWRLTVVIAGLLGLPWALLWSVSPIRREQLALKVEDIEPCKARPDADDKIGSAWGLGTLRSLLRAPPFYAVVTGHFAHSWMTYVVMAWLPMYMQQELGVSGESLSVSCLPYIATAISSPFMCMSAPLLMQRGFDLWRVRRLLGMGAFLVPAVCCLLFPLISAKLWPLPMLVIALALVFSTLISVSVLASILDIAGPQTSGLIFSISNMFAAMPGFLGVQAVARLRQCCGWTTAFASCTVIYMLAATVYARFGSAHRIFE